MVEEVMICGVNPINLPGIWNKGYALDTHTIYCIPIGENEYGHMQFDTKRSEIGELLYQFKYQNAYDNLNAIIDLVKPFLSRWEDLTTVTSVLPAPSSNHYRKYQPVFEITQEIASFLKINYYNDVLIKNTEIQAKNLAAGSKNLISGTIIQSKKAIRKCDILLVDDLYDTGTTLTECVKVLRKDSNIGNIYVLTMTKTKG